jgi:hypothetical protein
MLWRMVFVFSHPPLSSDLLSFLPPWEWCLPGFPLTSLLSYLLQGLFSDPSQCSRQASLPYPAYPTSGNSQQRPRLLFFLSSCTPSPPELGFGMPYACESCSTRNVSSADSYFCRPNQKGLCIRVWGRSDPWIEHTWSWWTVCTAELGPQGHGH